MTKQIFYCSDCDRDTLTYRNITKVRCTQCHRTIRGINYKDGRSKN